MKVNIELTIFLALLVVIAGAFLIAQDTISITGAVVGTLPVEEQADQIGSPPAPEPDSGAPNSSAELIIEPIIEPPVEANASTEMPAEPIAEEQEESSVGIQQIGTQAGESSTPQITIVLNTTNLSTNNTGTNLTAYNTTQVAGNSSRVIWNWLRNNTPITVVNMPMEGINRTAVDNGWDYSGYGNNASEGRTSIVHAEISATSAAWSATGGFDGKGAYTFDGINDYISIRDSGSLNMFNFSISMWIKLNATGGANWMLIKGDNRVDTGAADRGEGAGYEYAITGNGEGAGDAPEFQIYGGGACTEFLATSGTSMTVGAWTHVVGVYVQNTSARVYVNGVLGAEDTTKPATCIFSTTTGQSNIDVGRRNQSGVGNWQSYYFNGTIDELTIWNRSLSSEQVWALFNNQTNIIVANETVRGENWTVVATPNNGTGDGLVVISTNVTILNAEPVITTPLILNTTNMSLNNTDVNLTVYVNTSDIDNDSVKVIYNWLRNNTPIAGLNMPFEAINRTAAGNNTWDYSGGGRHGSEQGGVVWNGTGGYDGKGAYVFDGSNDHITAPIFNPGTGSFTWMGWLRTTDNVQSLMFNHWDGSGGDAIVMGVGDTTFDCTNGNDANDKINFVIRDGATGYCVNSTTTVNDNKWYHVAGVRRDGTMEIYVNGVLENSLGGLSGLTIIPTPTNITIGGGSTFWFLSATIDEAQIFNRSLSPEQIFAMFKNQSHIIVANETIKNENWSVQATPNDGFEDGTMVTSNNVTILNTKPSIASLVLNTTNMSLNNTNVNLTVYANISDNDSDSVKVIYNWLRNGTTITLLNTPFEGGSGNNFTRDYAAGRNATSLNATWNATGSRDGKGAYEFNNNQQIKLPTYSFNLGENITVAAWIRPTQIEGTFGDVVVSQGEQGAGCAGFKVVIAGNQLRTQADADPGLGSGITTNAWQHIAVVYNTSGSTGYINGTFIGSLTELELGTAVVNACANGNITIGNGPFAANNWFNGAIDDVMIFNRSLSAEQIFALWQNKTNITVAQETIKGENWTVQATPNDGFDDGTMVTSNNVTILNTKPSIASLVLNTTNMSLNNTNVNLTVYANTSDNDSDSVKVIYNWLRNDTPIAFMNMPFEGINNTVSNNSWDYSGRGNHGSDQGGIAWNATGGYDGKGAYRFTALDTYISGSSLENVGTGGSVTISAWIRPHSVTGSQTIFSKGDNGVCFNYGFDIRNDAIRIVNNNGAFTLATGIAIDTWKHVAISFNSSGSFGYIDGLQLGSSTEGTTSCASGNWTIGIRAQNDLTTDFNGHIDEMMIFNRSLSAEQIFALWQNKSTIIVAQETFGRENWSVQGTPNDGFEDGTMVTSNNVTIFDRIAPNVNITNPTNGSNFSAVTTLFNATITDAESDISVVLFMFNTNATPFNKTASNTSGGWNVSVNLSAFPEGLHSAIVFANDTSNNINQSVNVSFTVDRTAPTVVFTLPAAGATLVGTNAFNATVNDNVTLVNTVIFQFNDGVAPFNKTASNSSGTWNVSVDTTIIAEGALTVTVFANDSVGNMNSTQTLSLTVDNVAEAGGVGAGGTAGGGGGGGGGAGPTPKAVCQNGILENGEQCDSGEGCNPNCKCGDGYQSVKKVDCERLPYCGDAVVNRFTEQCDITDLNGQTCSLIGYADGELRCTTRCTFDVSKCVSPEELLKEPEIEKGKAKEAVNATKNFILKKIEDILQSKFVEKSADALSDAAGKIAASIKNYMIYWLLSIAVILIVTIGLYMKDQPLPEFLWKMKAAPQVKVEQAPVIVSPTATGKPDIHLRDWGKKNYLDLRQELKHVEALIKETPLPEQKKKALKLTSLRAMNTEQKQSLKNPATKQQNRAQTFEEVEQWITHLFASGTPTHKVATIIKNATLLSDTEIKTGLIKIRARHLLEKKYSLNQKALAELQRFIRTERKKGATPGQIVADLAREGWDEGIIRLYVSATLS